MLISFLILHGMRFEIIAQIKGKDQTRKTQFSLKSDAELYETAVGSLS